MWMRRNHTESSFPVNLSAITPVTWPLVLSTSTRLPVPQANFTTLVICTLFSLSVLLFALACCVWETYSKKLPKTCGTDGSGNDQPYGSTVGDGKACVSLLASASPEPEIQYNLILCMAENAEFEYNVIFKVGCPVETRSAYIDFEIVDINNEVMGTPIRYVATPMNASPR